MSEPIYCARCEITLGEGRFKCRRAEGTDVCISCAFEFDPPMLPDETCETPSEVVAHD